MNLDQFADRLRHMKAEADRMPSRINAIVTESAMSRMPPRTSIHVTATPTGAKVTASGPHAAAVMKNVRARSNAAIEQVAGDVSRSFDA